jgi:hypothetical protein
MRLLRRIAIGIGVVALAVALQQCAINCIRMVRAARDRNDLVAPGRGRRAPSRRAVAASEALAA